MLTIKEITEDHHFSTYKNLILKGLQSDEESFRIAPIDEKSAPFPTSGQEDSFTLGAFKNDNLVGVASFTREGKTRVKLRHKGLLFKIFVDPQFRKQGIDKTLIQRVIEKVEKITDIEHINLTVIPTNKYAKKLYETFGFETFSSEPKAIKWKERYFDEDQMKLILKRD